MNVQKHKEKALRIERSLAKCVPGDFEIRIEAAMLAATHWANLAFHAKRVTPEDQDVMHSYMLTINEYRRLSAADNRLIGLLAEIEDLRGGDIAESAHEATERLMEKILELEASL